MQSNLFSIGLSNQLSRIEENAKLFQKQKKLKPQRYSDNEFSYGFWLFAEKRGHVSPTGIYKLSIYKYLEELGYYKKYNSPGNYDIILVRNGLIQKVSIAQIQDELNQFVKQFDAALTLQYQGRKIRIEASALQETFYKNSHLICNFSALGNLQNHTLPILRDSAKEMFFPFQNCIVRVSQDGITTLNYSELSEQCLWAEQIIQFDFQLIKEEKQGSQFEEFVLNIAGKTPKKNNTFRSAIGFLLHNYSAPSQRMAVIAFDGSITDLKTPMGGSGKGILAQALGKMRRLATIDGKKFDPSDRFCFQNINETTQIVYIDDVKNDFDISRFNSILTEGYAVERKQLNELRIDPYYGPKTYITSNTIIKGEGTTYERRQFILEFSDFYPKLLKQKLDPIVHTHGSVFFDNQAWDDNEWQRFFNFMLSCAEFYLLNGLQNSDFENLQANKLRQQTSEEFYEWLGNQKIPFDKPIDLTSWFIEFKDFCGDDGRMQARTFFNYLKTYANIMGLSFNKTRSNHVHYGTFNKNSH